MMKRSGVTAVIVGAGVLLAAGPFTRDISAQSRQSVPTPPSKQATVSKQELREDEVKQLLLLMDTDKNGKISKKEWMTFMEAEFDRLDKDKNGELDPKELEQARIRPAPFSSAGK